MYFISKEKDLIGKEIIFTHFAQFADEMIIVTKDKGIFVFTKDDEGIFIYNVLQARQVILESKYIRKELNDLGIITNEDIEQFLKEQKELRKKQEELWEKQRKEKEYNEFLRLKAIYEPKAIE